ncbi:TIGR01458 family HAD-type hydrolase [Nitrosococcus wardiae]|uniref:Phospholysine phosphohistidine inorganic pyrophosphate phosphatase n=1 Tax=Nitrosococcus wardiae TaxID=1814290 RepID=A0A4P7BYE6_9GAMM|nr:TIGR01458 family HAD-type hydrolase [Nitrosococcus wardiae]QBQ53436.1 TIGR01458 family HAD-type hydrolase [Nitrosococcus wardiae]
MIKGVLLDLSGVLYVGQQIVPGALKALARLREAGLPVRYLTNTSRSTGGTIYTKLSGMGFDISINEIFTAPLAIRRYLETHQLRPYLVVHPDLTPEFAGFSQTEPNAVVLGDAGHAFTYPRLNEAFRVLLTGAPLLAVGNNRYFQEAEGLSLDAGPFLKALEYAANTQGIILGKPAKEFFHSAVDSLNCLPQEVIMVGDDAKADVEGALKAGLQGVLVKTGKYHPGDEATIQPPGTVLQNNIEEAVDWVLNSS